MKLPLLVAATAALLASRARAADLELSTDAKRMLSCGALSVLTTVCRSELAPDQAAGIDTGLQTAAESRRDLTPARFTEAMKAVGARVGANRERTCAGLTPDVIAAGLAEAATGQ